MGLKITILAECIVIYGTGKCILSCLNLIIYYTKYPRKKVPFEAGDQCGVPGDSS